MNESPIEQLLRAIDSFDMEALVGMLAPDAKMLTADGRRAEGRDAAGQMVADLFAQLHTMSHEITAQWHQDNVWIAEIDANYELRDRLQINDLPRAFIVRDGPDGLVDVRVYGAHERPITDHRTGDEGMWMSQRWLPPL